MLQTQQNDTIAIYANTAKYILHLQQQQHYYNMLLLQHRLQIVVIAALRTSFNSLIKGYK
jgi:hypothetical protein